MPLEIIKGEQAWQNVRHNKEARWPGLSGKERLYPVTSVGLKPSFKLKKSDSFFCIGSCFAREIEKTLFSLGFDVLSEVEQVENSSLSNKYNLPTILNELQWALEPDQSFSADLLFKLPNEITEDCHLAGSAVTGDVDYIAELHRSIQSSFKQIKNADVVVLTLGLSEVWFDRQLGIYLNKAPSRSLIKLNADRFELHTLNFKESYEYLINIYELLKKHLKPDFKILVTVSPVPLQLTFRELDVIPANTYSKSVLRTVVEEFVVAQSNVDYFPSYELVTLSYPQVVWGQKDYRHVDSLFVDYIMSVVIENYFDDVSTKSIGKTSEIAKSYLCFKNGFSSEAQSMITNSKQSVARKKLMSLYFKFLTILKMDSQKIHKLFMIKQHVKKVGFKQGLSYLLPSFFKKNKAAYSVVGYVDEWNGESIHGWAVSKSRRASSTRIKVMVNGVWIGEYDANLPRQDVVTKMGNNKLNCGFSIALKLNRDTDISTIRVFEKQSGDELKGSPFIISKDEYKQR
ncbi:hypothetical protein THMIRHAM_05490 [Thiomicrorhabdus immobilis]|uniref:GSCFA domain-containing protein n=1 Tax=Thiomicrorhabdus immobilis TaxID=2791037 RepID=A0ABM7MBT1_9GAMM|nr:GSCFA domain-containing protein [Thiomicrorhabdus immobilis]BCN92764.1 hypothetical protein THMIRHAM_05490 [Thiomicrorhabdus immobilis]